ncbi:MAG: G1 family endopeptidase [Candidatus Methanoperedens sp.]|nr:G1 family endopeptidase [Candidatus Methanoperedens sp.]MCZ7370711.1 G1 family endopeptidase [Candidatus Methanoperedens sp.]
MRQKLFYAIIPLIFLGLLAQTNPGQKITAERAIDPSLNVGRGLNFSNNWAGYVATGGTFTSVSGSWSVPQVSATGTSADATWVGIGGTAGNHLIQTGTQALANNNGKVSYQAWYEMLPANSQEIPLTINSGDSITASIVQQSANHWTISLSDDTTGQNYQTTVTYAASLSSAEWIQEMPVRGRSFIPLDNFGSVQFSALSAVKDGTALTPAQANAHSIVMANNLRQVLAHPSALGSDGASFTVARTSSTSTQIVSPSGRTGWRRVVTDVHGIQPLNGQSHSRGRFKGGFGQRFEH